MTVNDFYYNTVAKQQARELRAEADQARLAKIARAAAKQSRATRREVRQLEAAVEGTRGLRQALRTLFGSAHRNRTSAATGRPERAATEKPARTGSH